MGLLEGAAEKEPAGRCCKTQEFSSVTKSFVPDDFGCEQRVDGQVLRQDLVLADKVLAGVLQLGSSSDISGQSGGQTRR